MNEESNNKFKFIPRLKPRENTTVYAQNMPTLNIPEKYKKIYKNNTKISQS